MDCKRLTTLKIATLQIYANSLSKIYLKICKFALHVTFMWFIRHGFSATKLSVFLKTFGCCKWMLSLFLKDTSLIVQLSVLPSIIESAILLFNLYEENIGQQIEHILRWLLFVKAHLLKPFFASPFGDFLH